jgi:hypothetical protein
VKHAKRIDANQSKIVKELRALGAIVQSLADLGDGVPDLLVAFRGRNWLFEVKDWRQPPSKRRLTPKEKQWHLSWATAGQVSVIETTEDALKVLTG